MHILSVLLFIALQNAPLAFDVASVKPTPPGNQPSILLYMPGGGLRRTAASLKELIRTAHGVQDFQMTGGPPWADSDRYDVEAKSEKNVGRDQTHVMLQTLLADRFKLKLRRETRETTGYVLVVATGGPKMKLAADPSGGVRGGANGRIIGKRTMPQFAEMLSGILRRPVRNETGLSGIYEFTLEWLPDATFNQPDAPAPANPNAPSLFTAIQEQMGLRLESRRIPMEVLVIESAERPSEN
jgi:uncharacterized protein (TIGR03435 family)